MAPKFNKVHNRFRLNGVHYKQTDLKDVAYSFIKEGYLFEKELGVFLGDWLDNKSFIQVNTSGSTGTPKAIVLDKQAMVNSALATGDYFKLKPGDSALHGLPMQFIAGKMMLVRALILGLELDLVEPVSNPLKNSSKHYDFCAMTPFQVQNSLDKIYQIKTLIIGGAPVSSLLQIQLQDKAINAYETYGMTETITHIAAKKINNFSDVSSSGLEKSFFKTLSNIIISQDSRNCLIINAPNISDREIITNDIVKLHSETEFEWLGRFDNVINSGGIKIYPEQIEKELQEVIPNRFFIASEEDPNFGERVILIVESEHNNIENSVFKELNKYQIPKRIYNISRFEETNTGKIQRQKTLKMLNLKNLM